jgi:hypothetical protein
MLTAFTNTVAYLHDNLKFLLCSLSLTELVRTMASCFAQVDFAVLHRIIFDNAVDIWIAILLGLVRFQA